MNTKRYKELFAMIKRGRAIKADGTESQKLSDLKAIEYEFRINGPKCGANISCKICANYNVCWE